MKEIWQEIKETEGRFLISNYGRIKNKKSQIVRKFRINTGGYYRINMWSEDKNKTFRVHQLVAKYFIDNPNNFPFINHKDGNKLNNHVNNLEWCTPSQNNKHAARVLRVNKFTKLTINDVILIKKMFWLGFSGKTISLIFNIHLVYAYNIKNGTGQGKRYSNISIGRK